MQVDREVQKAMHLLEEVAAEVGRKKEASHRVKALRAEVSSVQNEMDEVEAQLRTLRAKSERISLWTRQHQHQVHMPCLSQGNAGLAERCKALREENTKAAI